LGRKADADSPLAELEKKYAGDNAYGIAQVHAYRGEIDRAFAWLGRAYRQHEGNCVWIKVDSMLECRTMENLRPDPRYKAFLRKMNLQE
jgi:hypothetical protein